MKICIWDLDFYNKITEMPNVDCMRLSSYHKQRGDSVFMVKSEFDTTLAYDRIYIARQSELSTIPPRHFIDDKRTVLLGKGFQYYGAKSVSAVVTACRPDYLLYDLRESNRYTRANFITFFAGSQLIKQRQDWHNTKQHQKMTVVTDDYLWKANDEEIIWCLEVLKDEKNIAFLKPISLGKLLSNREIREKFLSLHFCAGTDFKWRNDVPAERYGEIKDFMTELRAHTRSRLGLIPVKAIMLDHYCSIENAQIDFMRCLKSVADFRKAQVAAVVSDRGGVFHSPYGHWFSWLEKWTKYYGKLSFVEFLTHDICLQQGLLWHEIINNPIKWNSDKVVFLIYLLGSNVWTNCREDLFIQWGYSTLDSSPINYKTIEDNISLIYKDLENYE